MNNITKGPFSLVRAAFNLVASNPVILYPYFILAFIQILILEILYFAPRYPLSVFFGEIIVKTAGPIFLHYPSNYFLLAKWFSSVEIFIYIFVSCLFYGASVLIISLINNGKPTDLKKIVPQVLWAYIHLIIAMTLTVLVLQGVTFLYELVFKRALLIQSTTGIYFWLKTTVIIAAPYVQLLLACFVTTLFAFVVPLIMIERKKVFSAIILNFKDLVRYPGLIFGVTILTSLIYLPILLIKSTYFNEWAIAFPEGAGILLLIGILLMLAIDALQFTAFTLCYLFEKEAL